MTINPLLCGAWDGNHLWLQWEDVSKDSYEVEISYGVEAAAVHRADGPRRTHRITAKRPWLHVPLHHAVNDRMISTAVNGEAAREIKILRSRCEFEWKAGTLPVKHPKDVTVALMVDGAVCAYKLLEPVDLQPGESRLTEMEAYQATPWCQLDHHGHFILTLSGGGQVCNMEPSRLDYELTGESFTRLKAMPPGPFLIARGKQVVKL